MKCYTFRPILDTCGHWAMRVIKRLTPTWQTAYNGHLVGPVTLTSIAYRFAVIVELSQPVLSTKTSCSWDSNTQHSTYGANALTDCVTAMFILWTRWNATRVYIEYRVESRPMYYFFYKSNHTEAISLRIITTFKGVKTPFSLRILILIGIDSVFITLVARQLILKMTFI